MWFGGAALVILLSIAAFYALRASRDAQPATVAFSDFLRAVQAGQVERVTVAPESLLFQQRDGKRFETVAPQGYVASNPTFVSGLTDRGVVLDVSKSETSHASSYGALAIGLLFFGFAALALFRMITGRVPTLEKARTIDPQQVTVTFNDVAGVDE